jgi:hypothetical protein
LSAPSLFFPIFRAFDSAGNPLGGGLLYTYAAGSTTPLATYSDDAGTVQNANPVVLDTSGTAVIRLGSAAYKFVLKDSGGSTQWTVDHYQAVVDSPTFAGTVTASALSISGNASIGGTTTTASIITTADNLGVGLAVVRSKGSDTTLTSQNAFQNDPDLTYAIPTTGIYEIDVFLDFDSTAAGAGFAYTFAFGGTQTLCKGFTIANVNAALVGPTGVDQNIIGGSTAFATVSTTLRNNWLRITFEMVVSVIGTLTLKWCQNVSTASATTLRAGSSMKVTKKR